MSKVLLIGSGGHANSILETIVHLDNIELEGIIDKEEKVGTKWNNIPIIGSDEDLQRYYNKGIKNVILGIGSVKDASIRNRIFSRVIKIGFEVLNIIDPTAYVAENVKLGKGIFIGKKAIINRGTVIGNNCIVNTGAIIEHDCILGDHIHIAPGSVLCGNVIIYDNVHIGANATVIQQKVIGNNSVIGAGSVVIKDIGENRTAYGNPCREVN